MKLIIVILSQLPIKTGRVFEMNGTIYRGIYDKDSDILEIS
jgi:hypothetical protein